MLIAGGRRFRAWMLSSLKDQPIPVHVRDDIDIAIGEFLENEERKDFTLSEKVAQWRQVEPLFREAARKRQQAGGAAENTGRVRDDMKRITGKSGRTLEKAVKIVEAAERDPKKYGFLVARMDEDGADGPYKRLIEMQGAEPAPEPDQAVVRLPALRRWSEEIAVAGEGLGHHINSSVDDLSAICECGAVFRMPRSADKATNINRTNELVRHVEDHWRAALEEAR